MFTLSIEDFCLENIAESGQCFRMTKETDGSYTAVAGGRVVNIAEIRPQRFRFSCAKAAFEGFWKNYFDLGTDYAAFRAQVPPEDLFLHAAFKAARGMRILRQEPWETLISFILSQRKSIPAIRSCVEALCRRFGTGIAGTAAYAFPTPAALARASIAELKECALGYRAPYVKKTAEIIAEGAFSLDRAEELPDEALLEALKELPGVGVKVASCAMLFGFHRTAAFPRDVWILRVENEEYGGRFPDERYPGCAGVLQQYMFFFARQRQYREWRLSRDQG